MCVGCGFLFNFVYSFSASIRSFILLLRILVDYYFLKLKFDISAVKGREGIMVCVWEWNSSYALIFPYLFGNFCFNEPDKTMNICLFV